MLYDSDLFSRYPQKVLDRFKAFHKKNPQVWDRFKEKAFRMKKTGRRKYSARTIFEVMRWESDLETVGSVFKISNDLIPIYCRLLIFNYPEFKNFFDLKTVSSKGFLSFEERERLQEQEAFL